ncbi:MAG: hypothetical protein ABS33_06025 [Verrucomicrobia subdivision 6 bacterium BACL9 MAG-120924-bin69]|uniref:Uncharacterized protein n=1 Tax=Verrucomicrobia subdivision 6 bacterium BACL9 MAG-120924-bin69 TaxID=1655635 RepID=A0A0R2XF46_9BACT|nr:MAG: hypothetical protein ABS33_06025 [Verrucomicrobia subdivision 6 bacterium BACL9 MAG-120924-bin69]
MAPFLRKGSDEPWRADVRTPGCDPPPRLHPSILPKQNVQIGVLSHGDLSPDTAAQLWPVHTAFPDSTKGKNCS